MPDTEIGQGYMSVKRNKLNSWFNAILWLNIVFSGIGLIMNASSLFTEGGIDLYGVGSSVAVCVVLFGFYRMLQEDKNGFYLFVAGCLLNAVVAYIQYANMSADDYGFAFSAARDMVFKVVWTSLGKIFFMMLLMLLRRDGKNVYQVLWDNGK